MAGRLGSCKRRRFKEASTCIADLAFAPAATGAAVAYYSPEVLRTADNGSRLT